MFTVKTGDYTLTFKTHADFIQFRTRVTEFLRLHSETDAHEYAQRIAWRHYAKPATNWGRIIPDVAPIPTGLWALMKENWV